MKIYIGSDHAGYKMKEELKEYLVSSGFKIEDKGAFELNKEDDYPDFIKLVTESVKKDDFGIILGGSGQGEAICANRYNQARSAVYYGGPRKIIKLARQHNNANILSLGARFISKRKAKKITKLFLETPFSNKERHVRRIKKLWK